MEEGLYELEEEVLEESEDEDQPKSKEETLRRRLLVVEDEKGKGEGEGHKWFTEVEKSKLLRKQTDVVCQSCLSPRISPSDDIGSKMAGLFACSTLCVDDVKQHLMCVKKKKNSRKRKRHC